MLLLVVILMGLLAAGLLFLGAFPPSVQPQPVERSLPADRFGTR
jgi:hypothetical protein